MQLQVLISEYQQWTNTKLRSRIRYIRISQQGVWPGTNLTLRCLYLTLRCLNLTLRCLICFSKSRFCWACSRSTSDWCWLSSFSNWSVFTESVSAMSCGQLKLQYLSNKDMLKLLFFYVNYNPQFFKDFNISKVFPGPNWLNNYNEQISKQVPGRMNCQRPLSSEMDVLPLKHTMS